MNEPSPREMSARLKVVEDTLNLYRQHGLDILRTLSLSYHPIAWATAAPTGRGALGEPRLVDLTGSVYLYVNVDGGTTWQRVGPLS